MWLFLVMSYIFGFGNGLIIWLNLMVGVVVLEWVVFLEVGVEVWIYGLLG